MHAGEYSSPTGSHMAEGWRHCKSLVRRLVVGYKWCAKVDVPPSAADTLTALALAWLHASPPTAQHHVVACCDAPQLGRARSTAAADAARGEWPTQEQPRLGGRAATTARRGGQ